MARRHFISSRPPTQDRSGKRFLCSCSDSEIPSVLSQIAAFLRRPDVQICLADGQAPVSDDIREKAGDFYVILNETAKAKVLQHERNPERLWLDEINRRLEPLGFLSVRQA